jgi:SAM-dependent methyltransferase
MAEPSGRGAGPGARPDESGNWPRLARQWRHVGPPLRAVAQDLDFVWQAARDWMARHGPPRVLLLGVTPELYRLPWPAGTDFLAADHTQEMIDYVWPGPPDAVLHTEWTNLALPAGSRDIALCDGGLQLNAYPRQQRLIARLLRDVLRPGGLCILRLYAPAGPHEETSDVLRDLVEGRVPNLNILKLRLGMAMMRSAEEGVELDAVWRAVHGAAPDLKELAARLGWELNHALVINSYRGSKLRYHFVTADQVVEMFGTRPGGFGLLARHVPTYELGERCPTLVLQRLPEGAA